MSCKTRILVFLTGLLVFSCYKPYTTDIDNDDKVLVVDGLITNKVARYHIKLKYSSEFYSLVKADPVRNAKVSVTDDAGTVIDFRELPGGDYVSDSTRFTAAPGKSYSLRIEMQDGDIYESSLQKMEKEFEPDSVYAVVDYQNYISRFNQVFKNIIGATLLADIDGKSDPLPDFRFDVKMVKLYLYAEYIPPPYIYPPLYIFYCWQLDTDLQDVIISDTKKSSSNLIQKQYLDFVDNTTIVEGRVYDLGAKKPDQSYTGIPTTERQKYTLSGRIMYVDHYSINPEASAYYRKMYDQLTAEGKLFDPISVRIEGNIKCTSDTEKEVFGFFEVSALSKTVYKVGLRNPSTNQFPVSKVPLILPPAYSGCIINKRPPFWIN